MTTSHKKAGKSSSSLASESSKSSRMNNNDKNKDNNNTASSTNDGKHPVIEYEFFGPYGAFGIIIILPIVVLSLLHWCDIGYVDLSIFSNIILRRGNIDTNKSFLQSLQENTIFCPSCTNIQRLLNCVVGLLSWFTLQVILERCLPCELIYGSYIKNIESNGKLVYRINGHLSFWITLVIVCIGHPTYNTTYNIWQLTSFPIEILYEYNRELAFCTIVLCYMLSLYLYIHSFVKKNTILATGGNTGNHIYDFFIGRELNPRFFNTTYDWKVFCELRPGLIGWILLNVSYMKVQYITLGYNTYSMYLILFFQGMYVWDGLYNEKAILTTMDITTDGFGFMLVFGDVCWVPFTYSLQALYLVKHDPHLSIYTICAILIVYSIGYYIFRSSNSEKDIFRSNPNDSSIQHLQYIQTKRGTKLLISGWWGYARKINYTGDYIIGVSWCLVTGFTSIVPYYYAIYFAILLIHRSIRDDHMCQTKYGTDWDTYKQIVPYRFIPGII